MTRRNWMVASVLCGCGGGKGTGEAEVRIAYTEGSWAGLPLRLADTLGYFREAGIRIAPAIFPGTSKAMEALLGGSIDAGSVLEHALQLAVEGRPTPGFVTQLLGPTSPLVVSPKASKHIQSVADLGGATVGVASIGSQTHMIGNYLLESHGLRPDQVSTVSIGIGAASLASLERGMVDAGFVSYGGYILLKRKYPALKALFDPVSSKEYRYPTAVLCARTQWLAGNPDTARRIVRAMRRALRYVHAKPAEQIIQHVPSDIRSPDASVDLEALGGLIPLYSTDGTFPDAGFELLKRIAGASLENVRTARIGPHDVYTNEFVTEAR
ncbi:MAG: ABC transporter substrate-binding protein [Bryobacterales bacterium]|nr:ABC transporter substrate-binding protein [Bryobacterales bacterium]